MTQRKIILNLAISLDGYIATEDGGFDWIVGDGDKTSDTPDQFDFQKFLDSVDTIIMGRKAYEDIPEKSYGMFDSQKVYVATSQELEPKLKDVEFVHKNIIEFVQKLQTQKGKDIWIYGGAILADTFIHENVIDEYIIGIIPIILGSGKTVFLDNNPTIKLHLTECTCQEGITILKYSKKQGR